MDGGYAIPALDVHGRDRALTVSLSEDRQFLVFTTPAPEGVAKVPLTQVDKLVAAELALRGEAFVSDQPPREWR